MKKREFWLVRFWDHCVGSSAGLALVDAVGQYCPELSNKKVIVLGYFIPVAGDGTLEPHDSQEWCYTSISRCDVISVKVLKRC